MEKPNLTVFSGTLVSIDGGRQLAIARNLARLEPLRLAGRGLPGPPGAEPIPAVPGAWLDTAAIDARVGDVYPLYREPDRHVAGRVLAGAAR